MRLISFLPLVTLLLAGCLTRPPIIAVDSVEVVARNDEAMALQYNLVLSNPNDRPIEPLEFTYAVMVAGEGVYQGRHAAEMTLDAGGQDRPLALPVVIPYQRLGWSDATVPGTARWSMSGTLLYVNEGVLADTLLDLGYRPKTGFSASGELDTAAMKADPAGLAGSSQAASPE